MKAYRERMWVPWYWWVLVLGLLASVWLALQHAFGPAVALPATGGIGALMAMALLRWGSAVVEVSGGGLRAGRAQLPFWAMGKVEALSGQAAREARGPQLRQTDYRFLRGYISAVVRVEVIDPGDSTPTWVVSSRRPTELATAIESGQAAQSRQR
ncbi:MAG TPA: DUF3093 domain-containing protein [Jiangellaceae bacterium]|nr:DUF3093 domain-containing protein [Jiangellaceae bacterium]